MSGEKNFFNRFLTIFFCKEFTALSLQSGIKHLIDLFIILSELLWFFDDAEVDEFDPFK